MESVKAFTYYENYIWGKMATTCNACFIYGIGKFFYCMI